MNNPNFTFQPGDLDTIAHLPGDTRKQMRYLTKLDCLSIAMVKTEVEIAVEWRSLAQFIGAFPTLEKAVDAQNSNDSRGAMASPMELENEPEKNTPLDSLKTAAHRTKHILEAACDGIGGSMCDTHHDDDLELVDSANWLVWKALAEFVPGITDENGRHVFTEEAWKAVRTYDDGSPIVQTYRVGDEYGFTTDYYPRQDGPLDVFLERAKESFRTLEAERIAYEAAHPAPTEGGE